MSGVSRVGPLLLLLMVFALACAPSNYVVSEAPGAEAAPAATQDTADADADAALAAASPETAGHDRSLVADTAAALQTPAAPETPMVAEATAVPETPTMPETPTAPGTPALSETPTVAETSTAPPAVEMDGASGPTPEPLADSASVSASEAARRAILQDAEADLDYNSDPELTEGDNTSSTADGDEEQLPIDGAAPVNPDEDRDSDAGPEIDMETEASRTIELRPSTVRKVQAQAQAASATSVPPIVRDPEQADEPDPSEAKPILATRRPVNRFGSRKPKPSKRRDK